MSHSVSPTPISIYSPDYESSLSQLLRSKEIDPEVARFLSDPPAVPPDVKEERRLGTSTLKCATLGCNETKDLKYAFPKEEDPTGTLRRCFSCYHKVFASMRAKGFLCCDCHKRTDNSNAITPGEHPGLKAWDCVG